ncbi:MAG: C25 family cysteine peptidase [Verrucomicrobiota bacterium]
MNYYGHGGLRRFSHEGLLTSDDVAGLKNGRRLPVVTAMTCIIGRFGVPGTDAIGEDLVLHPHGGAIAVWAPTGLSRNQFAAPLSKAFAQYLASADEPILGRGIQQAIEQQAAQSRKYILQIYTILGDPALKIQRRP